LKQGSGHTFMGLAWIDCKKNFQNNILTKKNKKKKLKSFDRVISELTEL
jgi:hypothetical protein